MLRFLLPVEKFAKIASQNEKGPLVGDVRQPRFQPAPNGALGNAKDKGRFFRRVAAMLFDGPPVQAAMGHLSPPGFDQISNIFNPPNSDASAKLDRLRKPPVLDTGPPCGLANGDRAVGGDDLGKPDKAGLG